MFSLVPFMIEKIGIIIVVAFLLSQFRSFRQIIQHKHDLKDKLKLIILFGSFGIISNYTGIEVLGSQISEVGWRVLNRSGSCNCKYESVRGSNRRFNRRTDCRYWNRVNFKYSSLFSWWFYSIRLFFFNDHCRYRGWFFRRT